MVSVIVKHRVENYEKWRSVFRSLAPARASHGCRAERVQRFVDDPLTVVITTDWASAEAARGYFASPTLKDGMAKAGVIEAPSIYVVADAEG